MLLVIANTAIAQDAGGDQQQGQTISPNQSSGDDQSKAAPSEQQQRELGADEDPMAAAEAKREVERSEEKKDRDQTPSRSTGFDVYGSTRLRYRFQGDEHDLQDGGSRMGGDVEWQFREGSFLFARYEMGFNVVTGIQDLNPGKNTSEEFEDSIFTRLGHVGLDAPGFSLVAGKNWSAYYKVAAFTDRFMGTGGSASGAFNALTDGGPTGPGRADKAFQAKLSTDFLPHTVFKPFDLYVQAQHGNPVPFGDGADYGTAVGVSAVVTTHNDLKFGFAYNHSEIDLDQDPSLRKVGISGDARAALAGIRGFGERWYAGLVLSRLENHETTDSGIYFKGWGSELYGQYQISERLWLTGGFNVLEPDRNQVQAGDFRVRYAVAGMRYTFDKFRRMIFANVRIDDSLQQDGTPGDNFFTIGIRWDLSKHGWHVSGGN